MTDPTVMPALSAREAETLVQSVAHLAGSNLPLAAGLRAAAQEASSRKMSKALRHLAAAMERGESLEAAIARCKGRVPAYLAGFLTAAQRTGKLGVVLTEWVENQWATRMRWQSVWEALTYPALALGMTLGVFLFLALAVVPPFRSLLIEFGLKLPMPTHVLFWICDVGVPLIAAGLAAVVVGILATRVVGGRAAISQLMGALPVTGKLWYWSGSAEGLRAVGLLVENAIPLPESLSLAGQGVSDAYTGQSLRALGKRVEEGQRLWEALLRTRMLPMSIIPVIRLGEQQGTLDSSLCTAAQMLEDRVQARQDLVVQVLPPIIFLVVALLIGTFVVGMYFPLIGLIQGLA